VLLRLVCVAALALVAAGCAPGAGGGSPQLGAARVTPPPEDDVETDADVARRALAAYPTAVISSSARVFDQQFIDAMVPHHQLEVELARIAVARAQHEELRQLAQEMIDTETQEINDMQAWREEWFGSRATPPMGGAAEIAALQAAPDPIDGAFIDAIVPLHQQAMELANRALLEAGQQDILDLAGAMLADQSRQNILMQGWRSAW
jgi:uncharacterized protein (DUF305 family)